ncbi:cell surface glycoprotein related protein [Halocatena salina]|uniref:Cell surface glycoprotein related protein n=1 Tax=Halocatena salina TaxID=2934340 RepID=A0A8U0A738_9EURY|nr:cell surface glycoprotein related protein [Halocatena salina]UPM45011.1 cell surface glycoprotein related protein [Halocatena salina]
MNRLLLAVVSLTVVVVVASTPLTSTMAQKSPQTFVIEQGDRSIRVTPLGDGSRSVEEFYDYRSPATEPEGQYGSYGTSNIQINQVSQLFIYRGSSGLSLVFLHDKSGDEGGAVITGDISGLPANGDWVVEDDTYNNRDDVFQHNDGSSHIEWLLRGNRTDGAAFRGLGRSSDTTITVDMKFNERSANYPFEEWEGPPDQNEIERWVVRSGTGEMIALDMNDPIEISSGTSGAPSTLTETGGTVTPTSSTGTPATTTQAGSSDGFGVSVPRFDVGLVILAVVALTATALLRRTG